MAKTRSFFTRERKVRTADRFVREMQKAGLVMQGAGSSDGPEWIVDGRPLKNFASCSYMGLEQHPDLLAGAQAALHEFGSNFSISRAYLQCPLYEMLERALGRIMERHVVVAPSTTMVHLAA